MMNTNMTRKERNLLKGAIRRVFARSDMRQLALALTKIVHFDPRKPKVKHWCRCPECNKPTPRYLMQVDHVVPVIRIGITLEDMTWDDLVNSIWCDASNLRAICLTCHKIKCNLEASARKAERKRRRNSNE